MDINSISLVDVLIRAWPVLLGIITLIIVLAKMHGDIVVLKEKVKSLFDLWNSRSNQRSTYMNYRDILSRIGSRIQMIMLDRDAMRLVIAVFVIIGFVALAVSFGKITL